MFGPYSRVFGRQLPSSQYFLFVLILSSVFDQVNLGEINTCTLVCFYWLTKQMLVIIGAFPRAQEHLPPAITMLISTGEERSSMLEQLMDWIKADSTNRRAIVFSSSSLPSCCINVNGDLSAIRFILWSWRSSQRRCLNSSVTVFYIYNWVFVKPFLLPHSWSCYVWLNHCLHPSFSHCSLFNWMLFGEGNVTL